MMQPPPPSYADPYTRADVEISMLVLRAVLRRQQERALSSGCLASAGDLVWNLVEEALMRLLFANQVRRTKSGKVYVYWANKTLPPAVSVVVPDRLRMFMRPPWARTQP